MNIFDGIEEATGKPTGGPVASLEFRRIKNLPRRDWTAAEDIPDLVAGLTELLKTPEGEWTLKVIQAAALRELYDFGGLFGPVAVGGGKTLITLLAPVLLEAQRPVLLVPASVRDQTLAKVLPQMEKHWRIHPNLKVIGYEELSLAKNAGLLERLQPDMILSDECHYLKNPKSGRTRRVSRYMNAHPATVFLAVSGTVANHSILHYWHVSQWALKPDNTPLPRGFIEAREWANSLDERVSDEDRTGPGALAHFCEKGEHVRQGYRRRLTETPGVLATGEDELGVSLRVMGIRNLKVPKEVKKIISQVKETWETPDGEVIMEAVQIWKIMRELVSGFYYRWNPKPPQEWLRARKAWGKYVRGTLTTNRRRLDTPLQVWNEAERQGNVREFTAWKALKDTFKPKTETVWIDDYLIKFAANWLQEPGICWVEHQAVGAAVAKMSGAPLFGAGDSRILDASGPIVASISAHGTGKNLQQWDRGLVVCPPTSGGTWEQLLGREHRDGQESDTVTYETLIHHPAFKEAMEQAFLDARFLEDSLGNKQRLLYCDTNMERK